MGLHKSPSNISDQAERVIDFGRAEYHPPFADNRVSTSKYSLLSFFPLAIREQFRRNGNVYFLVIGFLMFLGYYTPLFDSAITPWTTLGPLAVVISVSLVQEGYTDIKRHQSDKKTNFHPCIVLRRGDDLDQLKTDKRKKNRDRKRDPRFNGGKDITVEIESETSPVKGKQVPIAFEQVYRKNIYAGDLVLVRNREMIPADLILLASSNEGGGAYVETSSIDGETNLKLRNSPHLPSNQKGAASRRQSKALFGGSNDEVADADHGTSSSAPGSESLFHAVERIANISCLGHPEGTSAVLNPANANEQSFNRKNSTSGQRASLMLTSIRRTIAEEVDTSRKKFAPKAGGGAPYIATLTSEPPNTHVNNFTGKLTLPPDTVGARSEHAPLNAENILLRGAALRNTEWIIGVACFTGADTKLVMNSVATPSKFSQLDRLINRTVVFILFLMIVSVCSLAAASVYTNNKEFDKLWFAGYNSDLNEPWPYFNLDGSSDIPPPKWDEHYSNYFQMVFLFITMLSNFVPLSLYVSVELVTVMMMLFIGWDIHMYHEDSDTPAAARSTIVTDLGLVEYIFSDKTGTLTCNVMEFKRCSVDGRVFGMPIAKSTPQRKDSSQNPVLEKADSSLLSNSVHPLRHLLAGSAPLADNGEVEMAFSTENVEIKNNVDQSKSDFANKLTFNAEMFLRVMSICHTVVVEKDSNPETESNSFDASSKRSWGWKNSNRPRADTDSSANSTTKKSDKKNKQPKAETPKAKKKTDGAPEGFAYQAESPDEGALVSAASIQYGFQLIGRDSSGVRISCPYDSLFEDKTIAEGLKNGTLTSKILASQTASPSQTSSRYSETKANTIDKRSSPRIETWPILAVNKFDSDRKRMSVLVRSPPELGSVPILLCKGADSSMMTEGVCDGIHLLESVVNRDQTTEVLPEDDTENWELSCLLGVQAHLGEFASEGLRTLVLGVKILTEEETEKWLQQYKEATTSIENRDKKLTAAAYEIEKNLHIVGATAIEDRLQDGVPETIANLGKAGIKLWVLTGDKRETAIEIGYSTKVLTPKMHLTEVVDGPPEKVKTLVAMELMRHIKIGNLPDYQITALDEPKKFSIKSARNFLSLLGHWWNKFWLSWRYFYSANVKRLWLSKSSLSDVLEDIEEEMESERRRVDPRIQRRKVRETARSIIKEFWKDPKNSHLKKSHGENYNDEEASLVSDEPPAIFERAKSARESLENRRQSKNTVSKQTPVQKLALAKVSTSDRDLFDEEALSMLSYNPSRQTSNFDKRKRTILERLFAVDSDVRHGKLSKHLKDEYLEALALESEMQSHKDEMAKGGIGAVLTPAHDVHFDVASVQRGLVVEGAALKHLLGDPVLEEMLFAVASCCESVIACRVSPIQKALLLKMVRKYVSPTPTTLAIGDGANDVGMIQEAHVGIGISGLEGQQAVNSSDFAIAQFRYLESLLLIHGRWNFMRMSKTVLYFFYKNAVLIGTMMAFSSRCLHSGTPLYDQWVIAVFNFVGGSVPIIFMAIFDRDLSRDYVMKNPEVYKSGPNNEFLSFRMTLRWVAITIIHALTIYHFTAPSLILGGGVTSAFKGLMGNVDRDYPGDGEGGDLKIFGTTIYSNLVYVVTLKALYETRSLIHGEVPTFTCRRGVGEGWPSRMGYTWVGLTWGAVIFYIWFLYMYQLIGRTGPSSFFDFIYVTQHLLNMRSITWMVSILTPTIACIFDVTGKVYSNMHYPTQTQIHAEIAAKRTKKS